MIVKSYIVEKNYNILNEYRATLLYGENEGIKDDIKDKIKDSNKEAEVIIFFEDEIVKNKNILYENIVNESLFNQDKIIFIQSTTDKILNEILESIEKKRDNTKIYIFSENLEKKSKLRNLFEKEKDLATIACYADNENTLVSYINKELNDYKGLTGEIINLIISNSNINRKIIQSEIVKIKHFFAEKKIDMKQLLELLNIKYNYSFDEMRDNVLLGDKKKINNLLSELNILSEDSFFYLNNLNYRILKLIEIEKTNSEFNNYEKAIENHKPAVFWKDKPIYIKQLKNLNLQRLEMIASKIGECEVMMKKKSYLRNDVIIKNLIVYLSTETTSSS